MRDRLRRITLAGAFAVALPSLAADLPADATAALRAAAAAGRAEDQLRWGEALFFGDGVKADQREAAQWFERAARQGLAAAQGSADAQFWLGHSYLRGRGVAADPAAAALWFRQAADQGLAEAQSSLGDLYRDGQGVVPSDAEALRWYRLAAQQGTPDAEYRLGQMLAAGRGAAKDDAQARSWLRRAADQGFTAAMLELAELYEAGRGGAVDRACSLLWTGLAATDWELAAGEREKLRHRLSADELAEGGRLLATARLEGDAVTRPLCAHEEVSIRLTGAALAEVAAMIRLTTGLEPDLSAVPAPQEVRLSAQIEETPWEEAHARLLASARLEGRREGARFVVRPLAAPARR